MFSMRQSQFVITVLLASSVLWTGTGYAQTLNEAVQKTLQEHPTIGAAEARLGFNSQEVREQKSGYFPNLSLSASGGRIFGDNSTTRGLVTSRGEAYSGYGEGSATLRQPILGLWQAGQRVGGAKMREAASVETVQSAIETLALRGAQIYLGVLRTDEILEKASAQLSKARDFKSRIQSGVEDGANTEADLQQAKDIILLLEGVRDDYDAQSQSAAAQYYEVFGDMPSNSVVKPDVLMTSIPEDLESAVNRAKKNNPAMMSALLQARAYDYDVNAERLGYLPNLDGELSYLKSDKEDDIGGEIVDAKALLKLSWDFETGGGQSARIKKKKFEQIEAIARLRDLERQIERDVRLSYAEHKNAHSQFKLSKKRHALAHDLFKTYENQFEAASVPLLQLMQADNQLFTSHLEKINADYRVLIAQYSVLASLGMLRDEVFAQVPMAVEESADLIEGDAP